MESERERQIIGDSRGGTTVLGSNLRNDGFYCCRIIFLAASHAVASEKGLKTKWIRFLVSCLLNKKIKNNDCSRAETLTRTTKLEFPVNAGSLNDRESSASRAIMKVEIGVQTDGNCSFISNRAGEALFAKLRPVSGLGVQKTFTLC